MENSELEKTAFFGGIDEQQDFSKIDEFSEQESELNKAKYNPSLEYRSQIQEEKKLKNDANFIAQSTPLFLQNDQNRGKKDLAYSFIPQGQFLTPETQNNSNFQNSCFSFKQPMEMSFNNQNGLQTPQSSLIGQKNPFHEDTSDLNFGENTEKITKNKMAVSFIQAPMNNRSTPRTNNKLIEAFAGNLKDVSFINPTFVESQVQSSNKE